MPRPRSDGTPPSPPRRIKLNQLVLTRLKPEAHDYVVWDTHQRGLAIRVRRSGAKSWNVIYSRHGRPRWYRLGDATAIGLADARLLAGRTMFAVAEGKDPAAERTALRAKDTFAELADAFVERYAKKKNKAWQQPDALVRRFLLPRWGKLKASEISRADARALFASIAKDSVANATMAAASKIFAWAMSQDLLTANPCALIERHETKSRERVLAESEFPKFWQAFCDLNSTEGGALKALLLLGQRPGEIAHMRREHLIDGWWKMPGEPVPALGWPGTKNGRDHRVWIPEPAQALLAQMPGDGLVFGGVRGKPINTLLTAAMRDICNKLGVERATPHDLRRTHGSTITGMGFGRPAMNRIQNHVEGGIASVYDRHTYSPENKRIMESVAQRLMALAEGNAPELNVVEFARKTA